MWNTAKWNWPLSLWRELQAVHSWSQFAKAGSTFATVSRGPLIGCANVDSVKILVVPQHTEFWDLLLRCEAILIPSCICSHNFCVLQNAFFYCQWNLSGDCSLSYYCDNLTCYDVFIKAELSGSYSLESLTKVRRRIISTVHSDTNNGSLKTVVVFIHGVLRIHLLTAVS